MIIALVALAVIFLITLGMGGCHSSRIPSPDHAGFVGSLKGLQGKRFLEIGDKAHTDPPGCGTPGVQTLTVNPRCVVIFEKRAFFRRSTRVVFRANAPVHVTVEPNDGPRQDEQLTTLQCFASAVNHSGGRMTLTGSNATVFLQRQPCPKP